MRTYSIRDLPRVQASWVRQNVAAGVRAMHDTAHRVRAHYVTEVTTARAVDTGKLRNGFTVERTDKGAVLANSTPYFSVIDKGRRPGAPGPPLRPILEWVLRKQLAGDTRANVRSNQSMEQIARGIAWAIRNAIHRRGIRPREITTKPSTHRQILQWMRDAVIEQARRGQP